MARRVRTVVSFLWDVALMKNKLQESLYKVKFARYFF